MSTAAPFFCVVSRGSSERTIEAEWPDGTAEIVETFADCFEALRWSVTQCAGWIDQRLTVKEGHHLRQSGSRLRIVGAISPSGYLTRCARNIQKSVCRQSISDLGLAI